MADLIDQANDSIREWGKLTARKMRRRVSALTLKDRMAIIKRTRLMRKDPEYKRIEPSIGPNYKSDFGQIGRVNFRFTRHAIFFEHGVGRGRPVRSSRARPKPWLAPVLDPAIDDIADILMNQYADLLIEEIKFTIPGILSRNIKINNG